MNNLKIDISNFNQKSDKSNLVVSYKNNNPCSYYNDDIWEYTNQFKKNRIENDIYINFLKLSNSKLNNIELLKEIAYILIFFEKMSPIFIHRNILNLSYFFEYTTSVHNVSNIEDINSSHSIAYVNTISNSDLSFTPAKGRLSPLRSILYKHYNSLSWGFKEDPFRGLNISSTLNRSVSIKETNQTEIIPENKWKEIIKKCIKYIEEYESLFYYEDLIHNKFKDFFLKGKNISGFNKNYPYNFKKFGHPYTSRQCHAEYLKKVSISCAMILQAFTGMRRSELMSLERNCLSTENFKDSNENYTINKITGYTFKYENNDLVNNTKGRKVEWLCPQICIRAIECLKKMNQNSNFLFTHYDNENKLSNGIPFSVSKNLLFISNYSGSMTRPKLMNVTPLYNDFLENENIFLNFKLKSHSFRRTLARFFAKSLMDIPVDALKEQFKHFSKDITLYYMKEDKNVDGDFINLIEGYTKENKKTHFKKFKNELLKNIDSAENVEELKLYINNSKINIISDYMISINESKSVSPLECLTCHGSIILPNLHFDYWKDMLDLYNELLIHEPNSKWLVFEKNKIDEVVDSLSKNKAYIVRSDA